MKRIFLFLASVLFSSSGVFLAQTPSDPAQELVGLWEAKHPFGPSVRGTLLIEQRINNWRADIAGRTARADVNGDAIVFKLSGDEGSFQGKFDSGRTRIVGHWIQPPTETSRRPYASPITLVRDRHNVYRGEVSPLDDVYTFYLKITSRSDKSVGVSLRNPERNLGRFIRVDHLERSGDSVKLYPARSAGEEERVLTDGKYDTESKILSMYFPRVGATFDFKRVGANEPSDYYPRGYPTATYTYSPPPTLDDGWQTASLDDVGISREGIQKFIQMIVNTPIDSVSAPEIHGVLIARHGKLVLEEYFHGEHREKPHDTRSAGKSIASTLFGAAVAAGIPLDVSSPVYKVMNGGAFPPGLEERKRALNVGHLLTMSSGLDCDDRDPKSLGGEDVLQQQAEQPDWFKYTLALKMVSEPGKRTAYCGPTPHLVGGVVQSAAGQSGPVVFQNLLAGPLQIKKYYLQLSPTGDVYMGGGSNFLPRDFMKLGQLHVSGGTWNGRKILTPGFTRRSTSHLVNIDRANRMYGYFWWVQDYPYNGRTVRAFFAGGNGGQIVMGIPELDLVIAFYGGNYNDSAAFIPQNVYVPQYILPAVQPLKPLAMIPQNEYPYRRTK